MKTPIRFDEVDHEVVTVDIFYDANDVVISAKDIVSAVNDGAEREKNLDSALAMCVSALISAGHDGASFVDEALKILEGRSGWTAKGRAWSCTQGRITWQS